MSAPPNDHAARAKRVFAAALIALLVWLVGLVVMVIVIGPLSWVTRGWLAMVLVLWPLAVRASTRGGTESIETDEADQ